MPDGKRNSLTAEDETTDGVNSFYDEDKQKLTSSPGKRLPLNGSTRGFKNLSDRLLRAMVANEIKKSLDGDDNNKLVAYHRPVLHSDNELSNGETDGGFASSSNMVVVGVVLTPKQVQNEEVTKALDLLRRNGVSCVCFSLKDSPSPNGTKKDGGTSSPDENSATLSLDELCSDASNADKKVSSPTVSTTSDYAPAAPPSPPAQDTSCTSTTFSELGKEVSVQESTLKKGEIRKHDRLEADTCITPPSLSPQVSLPTTANVCTDPLRGEQEKECEPMAETEQEVPSGIQKTVVESTSLRRKKRKRRLYPYLSRRKTKCKRKRITEIPEESQLNEETPNDDVTDVGIPTDLETPTDVTDVPGPPPSPPPVQVNTVATLLPKVKADPYEFNDSDIDSSEPLPLDAFKTPVGRSSNIKANTLPTKKSPLSQKKKGKVAKKKANKKGGSPRKKLTFSKNRAFSPDITENVSYRPRRGVGSQQGTDITKSSNESSSTDSCVQSISEDLKIVDTTSKHKHIPDNDERVSLVLSPKSESQPTALILPSIPHCDASERGDSNRSKVPKRDTVETSNETPHPDAQTPLNVQIQMKEVTVGKPVAGKDGFLATPLPSDSLQDTSDSMQLRRSSFYSSISRNVQTNLEKYLDGRPQDLKAPKKSKKFKNGFLLHHGDNFPDDPEAPYRLHLATQVLLKLNKRRVKCKPKEDKGKSLLSYLKLQPKRVSRVGKHSFKQENSEATSSTGEPSTSVFSGDWTVQRKYICNICGQVENDFWDMVMHKGELHPGVVVTHVELPNNPPDGFRGPPSPRQTTTLPNPPSCSKCGTSFNDYPDLHRHIFECAGNASILEDTTKVVTTAAVKKRKGKRKRGFKRKINGSSKKNSSSSPSSSSNNNDDVNPVSSPTKSAEITKRRPSEVFKCEFCDREFKTEGWLKNHTLTHSLPISIPLEKLSLPTRASISSSRRSTVQSASTKVNKELGRET